MFYAHQSSYDISASKFAGEGFSGYSSIKLPGMFPLFLMEIPFLNKKGKKESVSPFLVTDVDFVLGLRDLFPAPLENVRVTIIYPGYMNNKNDWQAQRIASIWNGTWRRGSDEFICTRINFSDGNTVKLMGNKPDDHAAVQWVKIL